MAKSLIRKNQLHPDIFDLVSGYGDQLFITINELNQAISTISGVVYTTGNQTIGGQKSFNTRPTFNGSGLATTGELGGSTSFNGNRQITANVQGFQNLIPGGTDVVSFLNNVFYPFISGSITLNGFPVQELGTTTTVINFQGTINTGSLRLNQFTNVEAFVNNNGRLPLLIPVVQNFNTWSVNVNLSSTSNNVYIKATGVNQNNTPIQIQSNIQSIVFEAPSWYGVGANGIVTGVRNMTKYLNTRANRTFTFNSDNNHFYYAYPNEWGLLTSIIDQNGFNITNSFSNITGNVLLANNTTNYVYRIYQSVNPSSNTSFNITFNF